MRASFINRRDFLTIPLLIPSSASIIYISFVPGACCCEYNNILHITVAIFTV